MNVVDSIGIRSRAGSRIELWQGDLTSLSATSTVDALLVSAFHDNYEPTPRSLIGALDDRGLSVGELAADKDLDIRPTHSCWVSRPFAAADPGLEFHRLICFEPGLEDEPPERVGDIFRALEWILAVRPEIRSVAMPVVAAGDMGYAVETMLRPILDAAVPWLELGLGLDRLAIATRSDESAATAATVFAETKARYLTPAVPVSDEFDFDVFVSYSHKNAAAADAFVLHLRQLRPGIRVFVDRHELQVGMAWHQEIFESLERSRYVVALLSPDYLAAKPCKEEFGIARLHGERVHRRVLQPVYAYSADLPTHYLYLQYLDAREGDANKLGLPRQQSSSCSPKSEHPPGCHAGGSPGSRPSPAGISIATGRLRRRVTTSSAVARGRRT